MHTRSPRAPRIAVPRCPAGTAPYGKCATGCWQRGLKHEGLATHHLLVLLGAGAAAFWISRSPPDQSQAGQDENAPQAAYDYEASDVVMRQMGPDGRMAFQIEAREITQLPDSGRITARGLTLYHDPPGHRTRRAESPDVDG